MRTMSRTSDMANPVTDNLSINPPAPKRYSSIKHRPRVERARSSSIRPAYLPVESKTFLPRSRSSLTSFLDIAMTPDRRDVANDSPIKPPLPRQRFGIVGVKIERDIDSDADNF